jgi:hypothetical protein
VLLSAILAFANAGFIEQPVAHYSAAPSVSSSSISYSTPVVSKTVAYSQPAAVYSSQPAVYASHQPTVYASHQPAVYASHQPAVYASQPGKTYKLPYKPKWWNKRKK